MKQIIFQKFISPSHKVCWIFCNGINMENRQKLKILFETAEWSFLS